MCLRSLRSLRQLYVLHFCVLLSVDINECASDAANNCQQVCHNSEGSYTCECNSGYELEENGYTCEGTVQV